MASGNVYCTVSPLREEYENLPLIFWLPIAPIER